MNVVVRTDASNRIGTGHLMRCFALGQALQRRGVKLTFVMRQAPPSLIAALQNEGFGVRLLPESEEIVFSAQGYESWLGAPWEADAIQTVSIIEEEGKADWLVVDHYGVDSRWEERVRAMGSKILVIDDLAQQNHACDMLLNQNLIANVDKRYRTLIPENCRLLLGPRFALLRPEFRAYRNSLRRIPDNVRSLLVFLGGADPDGVTLRVIKVIDGIRPSELQVTVVVGAANPHRGIIENFFEHRDGFRVIFQAGNMAELMMEADLAIGAGGISTWERFCLGLPAMVIAIAENQEEVSRTAAEAGACFYLGASARLSDEELEAGLRVMISNSSLRKSISRVCRDLVDGLGCERVAREMLQESVRVRRARADDAERVFAWRNAVETRRHSHDASPLSLERHLEWFRTTLTDENRVLLIGEGERGPIGVLRYDLALATATVSVYLDPSQHGRGFGKALLLEGEHWLQVSRPEILRLQAQVLLNNLVSRRAFAKAGFVECGLQLEKSIGTARVENQSQDN